jgi:hypothetical protein
MNERKLYAVISDWQNIEIVWTRTDIEATKIVLKTDKIEKLSSDEVAQGEINIEAFCHEVTEESLQVFDYENPDMDLVTTALLYKQTTCYKRLGKPQNH